MRDLLERMNQRYNQLQFSVPWVYNPWDYAREPYLEYWERYGQGPKEIVLMGMNPGPYGMAQTGVPFGEISHVRDWLGIRSPIGKPAREHPKRPILGWDCRREEVSGKRLWGALRERYGVPEKFFERCFVANYCPLVFMDEQGRNVTPDKLTRPEREALLACCDEGMLETLTRLQPKRLIGVGKWAEARARELVDRHGLPLEVQGVPHPSPANPAANRGWGAELQALLP